MALLKKYLSATKSFFAVHKKQMMMATTTIKRQAIFMYKTFIRLSKNWVAIDPNQTGVEKNYIKEETRKLFRQNLQLKDSNEITECIREAEARLAMAQHYRNPYPRPVNLPPKSFAKREGRTVGRAIAKKNEYSKPIYVRSIDEDKK